MSVNPVSSTSATAISNAASNYVAQVAGNSSTSASSLQEASETPDVTAKEAAKGDSVAKRLLAKQAQQKALFAAAPAPAPTPAKEPGKGDLIDHKA